MMASFPDLKLVLTSTIAMDHKKKNKKKTPIVVVLYLKAGTLFL